MASLHGSKKTAALAIRKLSTYTAGSDRVAAKGTRSTSPPRTTSAAIITARLLKRSMTTPANAPNSTYGKVYRAKTAPVPSADPVLV